MFHYTYVLRCSDGRLYIGCTRNIESRLQLHADSKVISTAKRVPVKLIYYEACEDKAKAFRREKYLKTGAGREYLKRRL